MAPSCRIHHVRLNDNIAYGPLISPSPEGHMVGFKKENAASGRLAHRFRWDTVSCSTCIKLTSE